MCVFYRKARLCKWILRQRLSMTRILSLREFAKCKCANSWQSKGKFALNSWILRYAQYDSKKHLRQIATFLRLKIHKFFTAYKVKNFSTDIAGESFQKYA